MPTILYHPFFTPELNWFFASYTESANSFCAKVEGVDRPCILLHNEDSVQKAKFEGWLECPEEKVEVVETQPEKPKRKRKARKK